MCCLFPSRIPVSVVFFLFVCLFFRFILVTGGILFTETFLKIVKIKQNQAWGGVWHVEFIGHVAAEDSGTTSAPETEAVKNKYIDTWSTAGRYLILYIFNLLNAYLLQPVLKVIFFFFFDATFGDLHLFILNEDPTLNSAGQQWTRGWSVLCLHLKIQRTEGNAAVQTKQNALTHFFESLFTKLCVGSLQMSEESGKIWDGIDVCVFIRDLWPLMSR